MSSKLENEKSLENDKSLIYSQILTGSPVGANKSIVDRKEFLKIDN
jgi:hypothetical protein